MPERHEESVRAKVTATHAFAVIPQGSKEAVKVAQRQCSQQEAERLRDLFTMINPAAVLKAEQEALARRKAAEIRRRDG